MISLLKPLVYGGVVGLALVQGVGAREVQIDYGLGAGLQYSSNINKSSVDSKEDLEGIGSVALSVRRDTRRLLLSSDANLTFRGYKNGTFGDRARLNLGFNSEGRIVQDRLSWVLSDNFRTVPVDSLAPDTPDNEQDTNIFTTGPNLFFLTGSRYQISLLPRYFNFYYSSQSIDNQRYLLPVQLDYLVSPGLIAAVAATTSHVDYDNNDIPDFDIHNALFRISAQGASSTLDVDLGKTWVRRSETGNTDSLLARINWLYQINTRSSLQLVAYRRLGDSGSNRAISNLDPSSGINTGAQQSSADTLTTRQAGAIYKRTLGGGYDANLSVYWTDVDYENTPQDRTDFRTVGNIGHRIASRLYGSLTSSLIYTDEQDAGTGSAGTGSAGTGGAGTGGAGRKDTTYLIGFTLSYQLGRRISANLNLTREQRYSDDSASEFHDNRVGVFLSYATGGAGGLGSIGSIGAIGGAGGP